MAKWGTIFVMLALAAACSDAMVVVDAAPSAAIDAGAAADAGRPDARTPMIRLRDASGATEIDAGLEDAGSDDVLLAAYCPVASMTDLYDGVLPPNPYAAWPTADPCLASEHDVIVILGCPNEEDGSVAPCQRERVEMALALRDAGYAQRFITTGAAVHTPYVEAHTLRDLLLEAGVDSSDIFIDPLAEHTDENIYYSSRIMQAQGWQSALVVSEDPGHLMMTAVCDANCCVELGRLTLTEVPLAHGTMKVGHYALYPWSAAVTAAECAEIEPLWKGMCVNLGSRRACRDNFMLPTSN